MATIVSGFIVPHVPLMCVMPDAPSAEQRQVCWDAFATIGRRLTELEVDTVIVVGDDHYTLFGPQCIPSVLIGIGDLYGPVEPWLTVPRSRIANNEPLAQHIMRYGHRNGVDWAVAKSLTVDHSVFVPYHHVIRPLERVRMIPVYLNTGVDPLIDSRRCYQIGRSIADAVDAWSGNERVAVFASGGIAHWPGNAQMNQLNEVWDRLVIKHLESGDVEALAVISDEDIFNAGGNGGWEIKNYLCMLGAFGNCTGKLIAYEAVHEWLGSCAYMEMGRLT
ncbi:protocatechuate 3,4-dioxygenase [Pseudomonas sp. Z18(2022)]|uniref:DODA-type extradiol aromatic ring-opening family dioxygenase n=1 Tax=Pseudomonas sp. Z18(2022) TaxID=2983410 RepID=UPI002E7FC8F6|nr:protocatechuate 3,4-dioxygenase [Pseudomonas sp. Z18(2022)]